MGGRIPFVMQFAFEQAGQEVLVAIVKPENIASQRVMEKLGFGRDGTCVVPDEFGEDCAFDHFRLTREGWEGCK